MELTTANIKITSWGFHQGQEVVLIHWENQAGSYVELTNYGATLVSVVVPEANGQRSPAILGFNSLAAYLDDTCYIGATVGRFANRIAHAQFKLEGKEFYLETNDQLHTNHGGFQGFNSRVFKVAITPDAVTFLLTSNDGDGGYPGTLNLTVTYTWNTSHELAIRYQAVTDKPTIANFTNHAYFNLTGTNHNMADHRLTVYARQMLEMNDEFLPTGRIIACDEKAFRATPIQDRIAHPHNRRCAVNDYYILEASSPRNDLKHACTLSEKTTGRRLDVYTTYPGLMVYTGDFLTSNFYGHTQAKYQAFAGLCLECQHYPDSPNHPHFPKAHLLPQDTYDQSIIFKFGLNG